MRIFALIFLFSLPLASGLAYQTKNAKKQAAKPAKAVKKDPAGPRPKATPKKAAAKPKPKATPKPKAPKLDEAAEWEKAVAIEDAAQAIEAFKKFIAAFPESEHLADARRRLSGSEAALADAHLELNEVDAALKLYLAAAVDAPKPIPATLFSDSLSKIPAKLFWRNYRAPALEIAAKLEEKADAAQLQEIAGFYLTIESGNNARRAAEASIALKPDAGGYLMLALADRVDFDLEGSAAAYAKALELDPSSVPAKRGLAEAYRSLGRSEEAEKLYREILVADPVNLPAKTGVTLTLFDLGKQADAEAELAASLAENANNVMLLAGVAYWYSSHSDGKAAVEYAKRAIAVEPRFIWGHIALARGQMLLNKPLEAEKTLLAARRYGNFPTIDYELARARAAAGFYREAAEGIARDFTLKDGSVSTKLGRRVERTAPNIGELISFERRASLFEPLSDSDKESGRVLAALLEFWQAANSGNAEAATASATAFEAAGSDAMKLHREVFAASLLVDKKLAPDAAIELLKNAASNSGSALAAPDPTAAVLADEIYPVRAAALVRGETAVPAPVPGPTLSAIVRGRIEELAGAALVEKGEADEALVRFKRSLTVAPENSVWRRSVNWRIGTLLASQNDVAGALPYYLKGYQGGLPDIAKYVILRDAYLKVKGNLDGFEAEAGPDPLAKQDAVVAKAEPSPTPAASLIENLPPLPGETPTATPEAAASPSPTPETSPEATPSASPTPAPTPAELFPSVVITVPTPSTSPSPSPTPDATVDATPEASPTASPTPEATAEPTPEASPSPSPTPEAAVEPTPEASPVVSPTPEATFEPTPEASVEPTPEASPAVSPTPEATVKPTPEASPAVSPTPEATVEPTPEASPAVSPTPEATVEPTPEGSPAQAQALPTSTSDARPRIVADTAEPTAIKPCVITLSEIRLSMPSGDERGLIVGTEDDRDLAGLTAVSDSEKDVAVREVPVAGIKSRSLFVIRSMTQRTGIYHIKFSLPCGSAEAEVTVEPPPK